MDRASGEGCCRWRELFAREGERGGLARFGLSVMGIMEVCQGYGELLLDLLYIYGVFLIKFTLGLEFDRVSVGLFAGGSRLSLKFWL